MGAVGQAMTEQGEAEVAIEVMAIGPQSPLATG